MGRLTTKAQNIDNVRERGVAALVTALILAGLIIGSSPGAAVSTAVSGPDQVDLDSSSSDTIELTHTVDIEDGERIPVEGVQYDIAEATGDDSTTVAVDLTTNSVVVADGDGSGAINSDSLNPGLVSVSTNYPSSGSGYGYQPGYGYGYSNFGYGYGYRSGTEFGYGYDSQLGYGYGYGSDEVAFGYGYGYNNGYGYTGAETPNEFTVTIEVDKAAFNAGEDGAEKDYVAAGSVITDVADGYSVGDVSQTQLNFDTTGEGTDHTFSVVNTNNSPTVEDGEFTTEVNTPVTIDSTNFASDPDGDALTFGVAAGPSDGTATIDSSGVLTYTPDDGFTGTDSVTVEAADGDGGTDTGTFSITVSDTAAPSVSGVAIADDSNGDGLVTAGDTVQVTATVTDSTPVDAVTADASAFGAGEVTLADNGPNSAADDEEFSATFTVGQAATEGDQAVSVSATDTGDNGGSQAVQSGTLTVDTTAPSISKFTATNPSAQNIRITFNSDEQLQDITVSVNEPSGDTATLNADDFEQPNNGVGTYATTFKASEDGDYTVVLDAAQDAAGNDGSGAESDVSISPNSKSAPVDSNGRADVTFASGSAVESASVEGLPSSVTRVQTDLLGNSDPTPASEEVPVNSVSTYLNISPDTSVSNSVTVTVTVPDSTVSGVESPTLYHNPGNGWQELETTETDTGSGVRLTATTKNGLSPFAIAESTSTSGNTGDGSDGGSSGGSGGGSSASDGFTVSELTPEDAEVTQGEEITVSATITTDSFLEQTQDVEFRVDGETVATQEVTLGNEDSTTVEFTGINTSELDGEYEHGVFTDDDSQTGTLTVNVPADSDAQTTETATDDVPATEEDTGSAETDAPATEAPETTAEDGPGFTVAIALIAIVAIALLARRRVNQ